MDRRRPRLNNDFNQDFGPIALDTALTNSVNTWFGQLGQQVGKDTLFETMEKFGFNSTPPIDLPEDEVEEWRLRRRRAAGPKDPVDLARRRDRPGAAAGDAAADGEVAAAVANGGKLMKPQIWSRVVDPDGRVTEARPLRVQPADQRRDRRTADHRDGRRGPRRDRHQRGDLRRRRGRQDRHRGNARQRIVRRREDENQAWFIGFAPADDPKIAIAATVECTEQFGGDVAAPIFREVAEAILSSRIGRSPRQGRGQSWTRE